MTLKKILKEIKEYAPLVILVVGSLWAPYEWYRFKSKYEDYTLRGLIIDTEAAEQKPFHTEGTLSVTELKKYPDGSRLYDVSYEFSDKNLSKSQITASYGVAELYLGSISDAEIKLGDAKVLNDPPDLWHTSSSGPINWVRKAYIADIAAESSKEENVRNLIRNQHPAIGNAGITGKLSTGEDGLYTYEFQIRAMPDQYVGVSVSLGINNSIDFGSPNVDVLFESMILKNADHEK